MTGTRLRSTAFVFTLWGMFAAGCPGPSGDPDASPDASNDASEVSSPDGALESGSDVVSDALAEASVDAPMDTATDASTDSDAGADAGDDAGGSTDAGSLLPGDVCANAPDTAPGHYAQQSTVGYGLDYGPGTNCSGTSGRDRVYSVRVPAGARITASVTGGFADNFDPSVSLVLGPASNCDAQPRVCLAGDDRGTAGSTDTAQYFNGTSAEQQVFVVVDNYSPADSGGVFDLDIAVAVIPPADTCVSAQALAPGMLINQTTAGYQNDYSGGVRCAPNAGPDRVYSITIPAGQQLVVTATPSGPAFNPSVNIVAGPASNCDVMQPTCLAGTDSAPAGAAETARYTNRTGAAETVFVMVDSAAAGDPGGAFTLATSVGAPVILPGDTCANAVAITPGTLPSETTVGYEDDYVMGTTPTCGPFYGLDRVYSIDVPAGERLTVTVQGAMTGVDPSIGVVVGGAANCPGTSINCVAGSDPFAFGPGIARYLNGTSSTQTVLIVVDSAQFMDTGAGYSMTTSVSVPPPGDTCATAPTITAGTLSNETTVGAGNDYDAPTGARCAFGPGSDRAYAVLVPAGQRLTATLTPTDPSTLFDPSLSVLVGPADRCESPTRACAASSDAPGANAAESVRYDNRGTTDETVYLIVDAAGFGATSGPYTLDVNVQVPPPPPPGEFCQNAETLPAPGTLSGQTTVGYYDDYGVEFGCATTASPDRVYSVVVPAGLQLTVTPTSQTTGFTPVVSVVAGPASNCDANPLICQPFDARGPTLPTGSARYTNNSATDQTVFVIVDNQFASATGGNFDLTTSLATPPPRPPGDTCDNAVAITMSGTFPGESTVGYANDYDTVAGCSGTAGLDRVYAVDVAPGQTLTASVASADHTFDPSIGLILGPASNCGGRPMCFASDDTGFADTVNMVTYTNRTSSTQTVLILVDSFRFDDTGGPFNFTVTLM